MPTTSINGSAMSGWNGSPGVPADEVRQAIKEMKLEGNLKGAVLDLRGNPGGLLDAAVEVAGQFVPRGSMIVSTKGRRQETEKKYYSIGRAGPSLGTT